MSDANIFKLPTTFKHNHHDHDCSCVKCYVDKLTIIPKVEFVRDPSKSVLRRK